MTLTAWIETLVYLLHSKQSKKKLTEKIQSDCLLSEGTFFGSYQIDGEAVWNKIILNDPDCVLAIKEKRLDNYIYVESLYEENKYKKFWAANRTAYKKTRK